MNLCVSEKESFSGWFIVRIGANSHSELSQRQDTFLFQRLHSSVPSDFLVLHPSDFVVAIVARNG